MKQDAPVLIVGAGIGGLAAAIALRNAGVAVEVFERGEHVRAIGAGISLWMNAMLVLRDLGVEPQIRLHSAPFDRTEIQSCDGAVIRRLTISKIARRLGAQPVGIGRSELISTLHNACRGIPIHTACECVGFDQDSDQVTLYLASGQRIRGCALIGADGVRSTIRKHLLGTSEPEFAGAVEWRGISQSNEGAEDEHGSLFTIIGEDGVGAVGWYVDERRVAWSIGTGSSMRGRDYPPISYKATLSKLLKGWAGPIPKLIANTPEATIHVSDYLVPIKKERWSEGRVALLGDAAHTMGTVFGQGGAQTLEDAIELADCLPNEVDAIAGISSYEQRRMERVREVVTLVKETISLLALDAETLPKKFLRALALRFMPAQVVNRRMTQIMNYRSHPSPINLGRLDSRSQPNINHELKEVQFKRIRT